MYEKIRRHLIDRGQTCRAQQQYSSIQSVFYVYAWARFILLRSCSQVQHA